MLNLVHKTLVGLFFITLVLLIIVTTKEAKGAGLSPATLVQYADEVGNQLELPPKLLSTICTIESNWKNVSGAHGEIGVCQIRPTTAAKVVGVPNSLLYKKQYFKVGDSGPYVFKIQAKLLGQGLYFGELDGLFSVNTFYAVKAYQRTNHLKVDGFVGKQTWKNLFPEQPFPRANITELLWDPKRNILIAGMYLKWIMENVTDDPMLMAVAYNGGEASWPLRYTNRLKEKGYDPENVNKSITCKDNTGRFELF